MHNWSDKDVDWSGINSAALFISDYCRKWARLGGQAKEKWGTVRFYAHFGDLSLHGLIYPSYARIVFPKWLMWLDYNIFLPILQKLFWRPFWAWQKFIYKTAYIKAVRKWPHLTREILCCMDYPELLPEWVKKHETD